MISPKQKKILAFSYSDYDALICDGAIRSGKTSLMAVAFVDDAMRRFDNKIFGICGKTVDSAIKNVITPYRGMSRTKKKYRVKWKRSEKLMIVKCGKKVNYFEVFGGKDESSYTLIQGRTLAGVLIDEVALQPRSFVEQALARCSVEGSKMWFNCNPAGPTHWFYQEWIKKPEEHNVLHLHFKLRDNPSLSEAIKKRYETMYSGVFYDRYIRGLWVRAEGIIYKEFADNPKRYAIRKEDLPRRANEEWNFRYVNVGVDFGGNKSAFAFSATAITNDYSLITLRSQKMPAAGVSVDRMMKEFVNFCKSVERDYGLEIDSVYADNAEQAIINSMRQKTEYRILNSVKGEIIDRIRTMCILITTDRFHYVEGECDSLVEAMCDAVWDPDEMEDVRLDDGTSDIDSLDANEYSWSAYIKQILRG